MYIHGVVFRWRVFEWLSLGSMSLVVWYFWRVWATRDSFWNKNIKSNVFVFLIVIHVLVLQFGVSRCGGELICSLFVFVSWVWLLYVYMFVLKGFIVLLNDFIIQSVHKCAYVYGMILRTFYTLLVRFYWICCCS